MKRSRKGGILKGNYLTLCQLIVVSAFVMYGLEPRKEKPRVNVMLMMNTWKYPLR